MPIFEVDPIPSTEKIWRYMDLAKFIDLLKSQSLYMSSVPTMEDEWEGAVAESSDTSAEELELQSLFGHGIEVAQRFVAFSERSSLLWRSCVFINCWHRSEVESAAMWKLYETTGRGIAVQTTIGDLCASVTDDKECALAEVKYVDFASDPIEAFNKNRIFSYKRQSFQHEREVRLQYFELNPPRNVVEDVVDYEALPKGKPLSVDLSRLVNRVVIAPEAPAWFIDIVQDITAKYGQTFPVQASAMLKRPRYSTPS